LNKGELVRQLGRFHIHEIEQAQEGHHAQHHGEGDGQQRGHAAAQQPLLHGVQHDGEDGRENQGEDDAAGQVQGEHHQGQAQEHQRSFSVKG
jgi:hypothetical protein